MTLPLLAWLLFVSSRLVVLHLQPPVTDVGIYAEYARELQQATAEGRSFYEIHARARQHGDTAGHLAGGGEEYRDVEYPPLAVQLLRLPLLWMDTGSTDDFAKAYAIAYRRELVIVDVLLFGVIAWLVSRLYPQEAAPRRALRLLFYTAVTLALWHLLYERLDLIQALLVTAALALLMSRWHYAWSFAVLALAINFKLVPLVLAPVWVVGSLPADGRPILSLRTASRLTARGLLLAALTVGIFLPLYVAGGSDALGFLRYHRARGLEVESLWSGPPLLLAEFGQPVEIGYAYGSVNVTGPLTPLLLALAPWVTAALLLFATGLLLVRAKRMPVSTSTLARAQPAEFALAALLFLMVFVAANKVFSPQYLLWLLPLAALVPYEGRSRRLFLGGFFLVCLLSTILAPYLLLADLVDSTLASGVIVFRSPTARFVALLWLRNLLFLALTAAVALRMARRPQLPADQLA
jgi:hypothetical protein